MSKELFHSDGVTDVHAHVQRLEARVARLEAEVARLRAAPAAPTPADGDGRPSHRSNHHGHADQEPLARL